MVRKLLPGSFTYVTNLTMTCSYKAVKTGAKALVRNATNNNNFRVLEHQGRASGIRASRKPVSDKRGSRKLDFHNQTFSEVQAPSQASPFASGGWTLSLHGLFLVGDY